MFEWNDHERNRRVIFILYNQSNIYQRHFHRKAYNALLEADLLFEPPYTPEKLAILGCMKKMYLSPIKSMDFKEFRKGITEQKLKDYLDNNVFFYDRIRGTIKYASPYLRKYIEKEVGPLVSFVFVP